MHWAGRARTQIPFKSIQWIQLDGGEICVNYPSPDIQYPSIQKMYKKIRRQVSMKAMNSDTHRAYYGIQTFGFMSVTKIH